MLTRTGMAALFARWRAQILLLAGVALLLQLGWAAYLEKQRRDVARLLQQCGPRKWHSAAAPAVRAYDVWWDVAASRALTPVGEFLPPPTEIFVALPPCLGATQMESDLREELVDAMLIDGSVVRIVDWHLLPPGQAPPDAPSNAQPLPPSLFALTDVEQRRIDKFLAWLAAELRGAVAEFGLLQLTGGVLEQEQMDELVVQVAIDLRRVSDTDEGQQIMSIAEQFSAQLQEALGGGGGAEDEAAQWLPDWTDAPVVEGFLADPAAAPLVSSSGSLEPDSPWEALADPAAAPLVSSSGSLEPDSHWEALADAPLAPSAVVDELVATIALGLRRAASVVSFNSAAPSGGRVLWLRVEAPQSSSAASFCLPATTGLPVRYLPLMSSEGVVRALVWAWKLAEPAAAAAAAGTTS
jgi:hypothetical protein